MSFWESVTMNLLSHWSQIPILVLMFEQMESLHTLM